MTTKGATQHLQESFRDLDITNISTSVDANEQYFVGAGSPPAGGHNVQAGGNILSSGSRWVSFPKPFVDTPYVVASYLNEAIDSDSMGTGIGAGSITTGSCIVVGSGTSTGSFTWLAMGSGTW